MCQTSQIIFLSPFFFFDFVHRSGGIRRKIGVFLSVVFFLRSPFFAAKIPIRFSIAAFIFIRFTREFFYCRVCSPPSLPPHLKKLCVLCAYAQTKRRFLTNRAAIPCAHNLTPMPSALKWCALDTDVASLLLSPFPGCIPPFFKARHLLLYFWTFCLLFDRQDWESAATSVPVSTM